jgi:hypothetical protein
MPLLHARACSPCPVDIDNDSSCVRDEFALVQQRCSATYAPDPRRSREVTQQAEAVVEAEEVIAHNHQHDGC